MLGFSQRPREYCPKCSTKGFLYSIPSYRNLEFDNWRYLDEAPDEWLEWPCRTCGYTVITKVFLEVK